MLADAFKALLADAEKLIASFKTVLLVLVIAGLSLWVGRCSAAKAAVTQERIDVLTHTVKVSVPVYIHDTIAAYHTRTIYDTARVRDTVTRNDSVFVYRPAADTAVNSCTVALHDCEHLRLVNDSLTVQLRKQKPGFFSRVGVSVGPSIVARPDGTVTWGIGATVGIRVWP